jgi:hypothetical protein
MELGEIYGWDVCTNNVPMLVHTEHRAGENVRFSEGGEGGAIKLKKFILKPTDKKLIFGMQKSVSSFLGLLKVSKNANSFSGCLKVEGQL